ncbi:MAG TPA: hypothetical protein VGO00_15375 [Kofleriaceae bacterium]|nr:hypothetical protein [Kofleriaceae bacterium]
MRAWIVVALAACSTPPVAPVPVRLGGTINFPGTDYYRALWVRLAAEANETTPEHFERIVHVQAANVICPHDCELVVDYTYEIDWLTIAVKDEIFVHSGTGPPEVNDYVWYAEPAIRDDVAHFIDHIGHDTVRNASLKLAFANRDDAVAAFVHRFGHEPAPRTSWAYSYGKGLPHWQHPSFDYDAPADACVGLHVLDLVTGEQHHDRDVICDDRVSTRP